MSTLGHAVTTSTSTGLLAAALSLGLTLPVIGASRSIDDFTQRHDDRWHRLDGTTRSCEDAARFDASTGVYRIESACAIEPGSQAFAAAVRPSGVDVASSGDGYVTAVTRHLSTSTSVWLSLRTWGNERTGLWGYRFEVASDGSRIAIVRVWEHGTAEVLAETHFIRPFFQTGDAVMIEAGAVGTHLSLKAWARGHAEPDRPQLITTDTVLRRGDLAVGVSHRGPAGRLGAIFDDLTMRPATADVNADGAVDMEDVLAILAGWGACDDCRADIDGDGVVDEHDLAIVLAN